MVQPEVMPARNRTQRKSERINLCLTPEERKILEEIARREDRDLGYLAAWFVRWGLEHYQKLDASLVTLKSTQLVRLEAVNKQAQRRLFLREEAAHDAESQEATPEKKRA